MGNATIAANSSVEIAQSIGFSTSNASTLLTTLNTGIKALSVEYDVALTGQLMLLQLEIHILVVCLVLVVNLELLELLFIG